MSGSRGDFRLLVLVLAVLAGSGSPLRADLRTSRPEVRLGRVFGGKPLGVRFDLVASGSGPVEILGVERSCGCLAPNLSQRAIHPGGTASLTFAIRTLGHGDGPHTWRATIHYRQNGEMRTLPLAVHVDLVNEVAVRPAVLALHVRDRLVQKIVLEDRRPRPLNVTRIDPGLPGLEVRLQETRAGSRTIELIAAAGALPPGRTETVLTIRTDDPDYPQLAVPLTVVRVDDPPVRAIPEEVRLGRTGPRSVLVRLRPRDERPVKVRDIVLSHPDLECTWAPGPGPLATLRVRLKENARVADREEVRLDLEEGRLVLPVAIDP